MAIYTRKYLKQKTVTSFYKDAAKSSSQLLAEASRLYPEKDRTYDIFLSHSILDADDIYGLKLDIESMGYTVYIDWIEDPKLDRAKVTRENAALLKHRMNWCRSLFFATSDSSKESRWMPWELGYFDGIKGKVAILPVLETDFSTDDFKGQEYLGLYPYVSTGTTNDTKKYTLWIHYEPKTYVQFDAWLRGKGPIKR